MTSLVFLPSNTAQRPRKDQEVIQAFARSHAARVAHPRRPKRTRSYLSSSENSRSTSPEEQDGNVPSPSVRSVVQRGNSDPFQTFAVPITPRISQLLSFYANKLLPVRYSTSMVPSSSNGAIVNFRNVEAADDYRSTVGVLENQSSALGFFLSQITIMADLAGNQSLRLEMMHLKARALADFKSQLEAMNKLDTGVVESALLLLNAAVYAGDMLESRLHLKFVKRLLEEKALRQGPQSIGIVLLFRVLYMDLAVCTTYMTETTLDIDRWVPEMLTIALQQTTPSPRFRPPPIAGFLANLDSAINSPLLTIFFESRRLLWVWWTQPARAVLESGPDVFTVDTHPETYTFRWLYSQLYIYSCRLANYIASKQCVIPKYDDVLHGTAADTLVRYTQQLLALALLTLLSASCTKILVAGQPLRPGSDLMIERLKNATEPAQRLLSSLRDSSIEWQGLDRALLWSTFIGAAVERLDQQPLQSAAGTWPRINWFAGCFIDVVQHLQLRSKEDVAKMLYRFIYNDHMLPDPQLWNHAVDMR